MYRVICESYAAYVNDFDESEKQSFRYQIMLPFQLLTDINMLSSEKEQETINYKKLEDFIYYANEQSDRYPNLKAFLWTLESRELYGKNYGVSKLEELEEQVKIINMFLNLAYWK